MTTITLQQADLRSLMEQAAETAVRKVLRPRLDVNDMMERYKKRSKSTIYEMEARGEIPRRTNGTWSRAELDVWDNTPDDRR
jgi:hypothetical protein